MAREASVTSQGTPLIPLRARSLRTEAADALRSAIISGELPEGAPVNESQLALQLGISRGPIREALRELEQEGRVVSRPHRSAYVASTTLEDVVEAITLRELIEPYGIEQAMTRAGPALIADLRLSLQGMREAAARRDAVAMVTQHDAFHGHFYRHAGHRLLLSTWERIRRPLLSHVRLQRIGYEQPADMPRAHDQLLALVEQGDRAAVRQEILDHLRMNLARFAEQLAAPASPPDNHQR